MGTSICSRVRGSDFRNGGNGGADDTSDSDQGRANSGLDGGIRNRLRHCGGTRGGGAGRLPGFARRGLANSQYRARVGRFQIHACLDGLRGQASAHDRPDPDRRTAPVTRFAVG